MTLNKNTRAKRENSREYLMKLMYQTYITNGDITDLANEVDSFLEANEEYIVNRYEELVLNYSNKDVEFNGLEIDETVDRSYLEQMCETISYKIDEINELIEKHAKNWSVNRFAKVDLSILQIAIGEMLSNLEIPTKVSINEAIDLAKMYCDDKTPKFINGILGSVVSDIKER